jgi:hypothetical protein
MGGIPASSTMPINMPVAWIPLRPIQANPSPLKQLSNDKQTATSQVQDE